MVRSAELPDDVFIHLSGEIPPCPLVLDSQPADLLIQVVGEILQCGELSPAEGVDLLPDERGGLDYHSPVGQSAVPAPIASQPAAVMTSLRRTA
jgi:hypothetical protein